MADHSKVTQSVERAAVRMEEYFDYFVVVGVVAGTTTPAIVWSKQPNPVQSIVLNHLLCHALRPPDFIDPKHE